ncbi:MAG TPA: hypothetical protein VM925_17810 [Labilithrix sp.]|nr:hypothetical protein [Labilithrix sp.]
MKPPVPPVRSVRLEEEARRELELRRSGGYRHRTKIDESVGHFELDCSGFLGYALRGVAPEAFEEIVAFSRPRPVARSYHDFFLTRGNGGSEHWQRVQRAADLVPGDVLAWLEPEEKTSTSTGHVAIVDAVPFPGPRDGELTVVVIDSARSGHGVTDGRSLGREGASDGLGRGPVVLVVGEDGRPRGFRWSSDPKSRRFDVSVAMGRLRT